MPDNNEYAKAPKNYYVPASSAWPLVGAIALFIIAIGAATTVQMIGKEGSNTGIPILFVGIAILLFMLFSWFRNVISESMKGLYNEQLDRSFRMGMLWFIFSEVMFFVALFGVLFYLRNLSIPWLGGEGNNAMTHAVIWADFIPTWPLTTTPDGTETQAMPWYGLPLVNTIILITSSVTLHFAHHNLITKHRAKLVTWLAITVALGITFLFFQVEEYIHAYQELSLRFDSGVYGNTFYMLTGFHGMHVTLGVIMLTVMLLRVINGHFTPGKHFAFEATAWYWHFVDVVWIILFLFVYIV
ncbi:MAG: cytochrome c oxidase subunit 3 [Moritella dasanensis]|jgi:cytochrome c oxidase subunit 3